MTNPNCRIIERKTENVLASKCPQSNISHASDQKMPSMNLNADEHLARAKPPNRYLFLQGPPSPFARELGHELAHRGNFVKRVNFCTGDWLSWHDEHTVNFKGRAEDWEAYLEALIRSQTITHILYFADRLPYHVAAQKVAQRLGIQAVSYEFGYLRPDWITVEYGGQSAYSHFPDDLNEIRKLAAGLPEPDLTHRYQFSFTTEAFSEVVFNLSNFFTWFFFPHYNTDRTYNPLLEYLAYIPRLIRGRFRAKNAETIVKSLEQGEISYFVAALQMQSDYQIRDNSTYEHLSDFIHDVIASFARSADGDAVIVIKKHPLDNGIENWRKVISTAAKAAGVSNRVLFLDGGNLQRLLSRAKGAIVINSTVGLHALQLGTPVKCLGISVYDMTGLTHQGTVDTFWQSPYVPKMKDVSALVRLLACAIHVKGSFHSKPGRAAAIKGFANRLSDGEINSNSTFVALPPRLKTAQKIGISIEY